MNKKLLILYDYFDPAYKAGGPIRSLVNLVKLMEQELEIYILTTNQDHDSSTLEVKADTWIAYGKKSQVMYLSERNRGFGTIKTVIREVNPHILYMNGLYSLSFFVFPLLIVKKIKNINVVIAPRGMLQQGALKIKARKKKVFLTLIRFMLPKNSRITWHATDDQEISDIRTYLSKSKVFLAGNVPVFDKEWEVKGKIKHQFVSISLLERKKDHLTFIKVLKDLDTIDDINYHIYGPKSDLKYYNELTMAISHLPTNIRVVLKGAIHPSQVSQTLLSYKFYVLTSFGENFGHSIFEAFNQGVPVIISDQTPWKSLSAKKAGWDVDLQNPKALTRAIQEAIGMDEETYSQYQIGARQMAEEYMQSHDFVKLYKELFS